MVKKSQGSSLNISHIAEVVHSGRFGEFRSQGNINPRGVPKVGDGGGTRELQKRDRCCKYVSRSRNHEKSNQT